MNVKNSLCFVTHAKLRNVLANILSLVWWNRNSSYLMHYISNVLMNSSFISPFVVIAYECLEEYGLVSSLFMLALWLSGTLINPLSHSFKERNSQICIHGYNILLMCCNLCELYSNKCSCKNTNVKGPDLGSW